jgi:hypothetical protein
MLNGLYMMNKGARSRVYVARITDIKTDNAFP